MTVMYEQVLADLRAAKQRETEAARKRLTLFALESVATDGCPRVSTYTVDALRWPRPDRTHPRDALSAHR
ncbi:hypothetical protein FDI84_gp52 [Mycobacterium phage Pipsqueaks]|uniref:Uncharacterized protein n=1 Tax=Mycobacterium phage Pipsqueaks TaxID=1821540 RepID=A0A142K7X2_9CAUD|nr:hypothetical protein FDI84_gp52 [Mycobacterium phage Pipsqueaks]AMS02205.1 hypothetical protein SEA_PIPSQUEAKS_52 [Mycobacterium phage Pipsqueaks]